MRKLCGLNVWSGGTVPELYEYSFMQCHRNPSRIRIILCSVAAILFFLLVIGMNNSWADSLSANDALKQFDKRLFSLQPAIKENRTDEVENFIKDGIAVGYAPAYYLKGLRNSKTNLASLEDTKKDLVYALRNGVRNAALFLQPTMESLGMNNNDQLPYNKEALEILSENNALAVSELSMKSILKSKIDPIPKNDASNTDIDGFIDSALNGSILSSGFLLRHQGLDAHSIDVFCSMLQPSDLAKQIDSCKQSKLKEKNGNEFLSPIFLKREKNLQSIYQEHYDFYKTNLCRGSLASFAGGPICLDIIEFVLPICRLDYGSQGQNFNPTFVCSKTELDEYFEIYSDLFKQTFNVEVEHFSGR